MRLHCPVYLGALDVVLGELTGTQTAIDAGRYTLEAARRSGQRSVSVSPLRAPDLAVAAGRHTLDAAPVRSVNTIGLHLHSSIFYSGMDFYAASCYVARELDLRGLALSVSFSAMSDSAVAGIEMAASMIQGRDDLEGTLLTIGDRFGEDAGFDHWNCDSLAYGDAGAAVLVTTEPGPVRLVSTASLCEPTLKGLHRGLEMFRAASTAATRPLDVHGGVTELDRLNAIGMAHVVKQALADADLDLDDVVKILTPFYGQHTAATHCLAPLGITEDRTMTHLGLDVGHLGGSDQLLALAGLLRSGAVDPGQRVLLAGIGIGMNWTAMVVELTTLAADWVA